MLALLLPITMRTIKYLFAKITLQEWVGHVNMKWDMTENRYEAGYVNEYNMVAKWSAWCSESYSMNRSRNWRRAGYASNPCVPLSARVGPKGARISTKGARILEERARILEERARILTKGERVPIPRIRNSEGFRCDITRTSRHKGFYDAFWHDPVWADENFTRRNNIFQSFVRRAVRVHQQVHHPQRSREGQKRSRAINLLTPLRDIVFYMYFASHPPPLMYSVWF